MSDPFPRMPTLRAESRPPRMPTFVLFPTGPKALHLAQPVLRLVGPREPPAGFISSSTSLPEWFLYWASAKVFNDPKDPRQPPFYGGRDWGYQLDQLGGRREKGGAVVDFIYYLAGEVVGVRLQTYRFHLTAGAEKIAFDEAQRFSLASDMTVRDIYEEDVIEDETGQAAIKVLLDALGGRERINPLRLGTVERV